MNYFLLTGLLTVGLSALTHATENVASQAKSSFSGATLSGGLGYMMGSIKEAQNLHLAPDVQTLNSLRLNGSGVSGELALGYGDIVAPCFYLGGDVYAALSSLKTSHTTDDRTSMSTTVKSPFGFGLRVRPGWMVNPKTVLHVTLGAGWARWKMNAGKDTANLRLASASASKMLFGFSYGLGVMTKVCKDLSAGLEFVHTDYKSVEMTQKSAANPAVSLKQSFKPSTNVVSLRMTYHF